MSKIIGCGIDIEELERFKKYVLTHPDPSGFINLVYSDDEIRINRSIQPHITFPVCFSCKEAFFKAFGVSWTNSPISWKDIELLLNDSANLQHYNVRLTGHALEIFLDMNCRQFETRLDYNENYVIFEVLLFSK